MITTEEIIATLILKGFAPRDKSRDYIDFYKTERKTHSSRSVDGMKATLFSKYNNCF